MPLESNALVLRLVRLAPGPERALARPEIEAQGDMLEPPSLVERRPRMRVGEMVAAQVVKDGEALQTGRGGCHAYNACLKRVLGKGRSAMGLAELEAAAAWLERNRLADHLHLLDGDPRYAWQARRQRTGEWMPLVGRFIPARTGKPSLVPETALGAQSVRSCSLIPFPLRSVPAAIAAPLAGCLVHDSDFHDDVLEWVAEHLEDEEDEEDRA